MGLVMAPQPPAPAPPAPPPTNNTFNIGNSLPERSVYDGPSWRDFSMFMSGMPPNRGMPKPRNWSNMFDDDEEDDRPNPLAFAAPPTAAPSQQTETVEQEIIPERVIDSLNIPEELQRA